MSLGDKLKLARLLAHLVRPDEGGADRRLVEECHTAAGGARYDLYRPVEQPRSLLVAVHGGERTGWKNARLVGFARALARCGAACAVPELAGLARSAFDLADLDSLEAACLDCGQRIGARPGMVGFSYGGGYALTAASRKKLAGQLRFVVTVGAFHDLGGLLDWYAQHQGEEPRTDLEWDDAIWLKLVMAWWFRGPLGLSPELCAELQTQLDGYCDEEDVGKKRAFFERRLRPLDVFERVARTVDRQVLAELSPAGRGSAIGCPVTLIHDRYDGITPLREGERLHQEIAGSKLVVTEVLAHITPLRALDLPALLRLSSALEPLVGDR
ncbi:MAG: alpha/beta hydrolase [Myxococcales bacterium]